VPLAQRVTDVLPGLAFDARPFALGDARRFAPNQLVQTIILGKARMPRAQLGR
jgi:hypothetical protein